MHSAKTQYTFFFSVCFQVSCLSITGLHCEEAGCPQGLFFFFCSPKIWVWHPWLWLFSKNTPDSPVDSFRFGTRNCKNLSRFQLVHFECQKTPNPLSDLLTSWPWGGAAPRTTGQHENPWTRHRAQKKSEKHPRKKNAQCALAYNQTSTITPKICDSWNGFTL